MSPAHLQPKYLYRSLSGFGDKALINWQKWVTRTVQVATNVIKFQIPIYHTLQIQTSRFLHWLTTASLSAVHCCNFT